MASIIETVDFYRSVLEALGYTVRGNRVILLGEDGEEEAEIDGKQLVLPDDQFLRNPKWDLEIPFHPLCENPQRGESEVVKTVLESVVTDLNVSLLGLVVHLYSHLASMEDTKVLSTEQAAILPYLNSPTAKIKKAIVGMVEKVTMEDSNSSLITCNLRRRCPLGDVRYERVCVVRFPFAEMDRKEKPYGLSTVSENDTLRGLLDYILPGWEVDDTYSVGTNSFVAPYFLSVMLMYCKMSSRLNEVISLYKNLIPSLVNYEATNAAKVLEMIERPGLMEALRDTIPALDGNRGSQDLSRQPADNYQINQPKAAVNVPWEESNSQTTKTTQVEHQQPAGEAAPYVPGQVTPTVVQPNNGLLQPLNASAPLNGLGMTYDPNSFHGRQQAKQALMQPLSAHVNQHQSIGGSPFIEREGDNRGGAEYRPGQMAQARQQQQQRQTLINNGQLGF